MERVIVFSIEHVLVQNAFQFHRIFGVPAAFHFTFHLRSSNAFTVRLLLSGTVLLVRSSAKPTLSRGTLDTDQSRAWVTKFPRYKGQPLKYIFTLFWPMFGIFEGIIYLLWRYSDLLVSTLASGSSGLGLTPG